MISAPLAARLLLGLAAVAGAPALAADPAPFVPTPGTLVDRVDCAEFPGRSYALYLPSGYTPERRWPILYAFDPRNNGPRFAKLFRAAAEELGVIVASSNDSRSDGPVEPNLEAMKSIWEDTHARLSIDPERVYATGFSGGSRTAVMLATVRLGEVAGVIGVGAGFPEGWSVVQETPFAWYGLAGEGDFNWYELQKLDRAYAAHGLPHAFESFPGDHTWPSAERCADALGWMETLAMRRGATPRREEHLAARRALGRARAEELLAAGDPLAAVRRYDQLVAELDGLAPVDEERAAAERLRAGAAWREEVEADRRAEAEFDAYVVEAGRQIALALRQPAEVFSLVETVRRLEVARLEKVAAKSPSPAARRGARQSRNALLVQVDFYLPESRAAAGDHAGAARLLEIATAIAPADPESWFRLGRERALAGDPRGALAALDRAVDAGWKDAGALTSETAFAGLHERRGWRELLARLAGDGKG